ncbi:hypothetical protein BJV77DRAFT_1067314 [Russula vinacea]|nr:hypothetical protein BJV77DRAFT_1067314 [Russula vinacea]
MRVAVVGSGVAGLAATWLLNEYSPHEAHLYEADGRPGGHANTVHVTQPGKEPVAVDTGFIVFNPPTYPNFLRFLALHKRSVEVIKTQMTFSVSRDGGAFERVFDLGMWRMLFDIMRFNACAVRVLIENDDLSIGEYLQREGYSSQFRDDYLIPMTAAVWSTPPDVCAIDFPAKTLIRFMYNHHLLQITGKPSWLTIKGGSKKYVESILSQLPAAQLHLSTPVHAVWSGDGNTIMETATGKREAFDHIIFACHSEDALRILDAGSGATPTERETLGAFRWSRNEVWLHSDESLMPRSRLAWSCWNYITRTTVNEQGMKKANDPQVSFIAPPNPTVQSETETDWMNDLQRLPSQKHGDLFATLNPLFPPSPTRVLGHYTYAHPVLSADAVRAQHRLAQLNAQMAGREDGFASGLRAAAALPGVAPPFAIADADVERGEPRAGTMARLFDVLEVVRAFVALLVGRVLFVVVTATRQADRKLD